MFPGLTDVLPERWGGGGVATVMQDRFDRDMEQAAALRVADLKSVKAGERTVMVDFTADWCVNCKVLERTVLNTQAVHEAVARNNVVVVQADWTHGSPEVTKMMELLGSKGVPVLAIFPAGNPNEPIVLRDGYTPDTVVAALDNASAKVDGEKSAAPGQPAEGSQAIAGEETIAPRPL